jgi:hypothetical protein
MMGVAHMGSRQCFILYALSSPGDRIDLVADSTAWIFEF